MIDYKLPPLSTVRNAIHRERNKVVTADQALKIACKKRGWNINRIRQYIADNTVRKPGYLPCRKSLLRLVAQFKRDKVEYQEALEKIAQRYGNNVKAVADKLAEQPKRKQKLKRTPEIGLCDCGRTAALQMRYGKKRCYECHADYSRDVKTMPSESDINLIAEQIRTGTVPGDTEGKFKPWSDQVLASRAGIFYQPYTVPGTTCRHNLNGISDGSKHFHDDDI